ncbi:MAG: hypothetical protein K0S58_2868 [Nitrospira sp.]|jgi:hypothetical protein|nr:hypothetical protein [Nitrospira sp.]
MPSRKSLALPTTKSIASSVKKHAGQVKKIQTLRHGEAETVREAEYRGHHIVVRTRYDIEVDGRMVMGHMGVTNDGKVHYHPVPNMAFVSAIDMVKKLIDVFPDDFSSTGMGRKAGRKKKKARMAHRYK